VEQEMDSQIEKLIAQLERRGLKGKVVSIRRLPEVRDEILGRRSNGQFDETFYRERLTFFDFSPPKDLPGALSLILVAVPRAQTRVTFTRHGERRALILPPTYLGYPRVFAQTGELLEEILAAEGFRVARSNLPQKLLCVRSGLAEYGRNNITYISGLGSFYQPTAFFSDLSCASDNWREPVMLERCNNCKACLIKCPTGAITQERFLFHAERCLVFHNERSASIPFPAWIDPTAHNCLMGCMLCQQFCPEDKPFLDWFEGDEEFSPEETDLIMGGVRAEQLPAGTREKLERLALLDDLEILPRNLAVFFPS
jgi:epoxyqueuosine reductase